jgi:nucleoside-diphosphate-sugar epimerase
MQGIQALLKKIHYRTYNIFLAAKKSGVKRIIYASSLHAVSGYPKDTQVKTTDPVNPGDLYGMKSLNS